MKRTLIFTILLLAIGPASLAKAEYIGVWRWLGLGWGPGYHSGQSRHHGHHGNYHQYQGQPIGAAWEEARPVAPEPTPAAPPVVEIEGMPDPAASRSSISPAQQAAMQREMQRRAAIAPGNSAAPGFNSYFNTNR